MEQELIEALSNVNISSESAEIIADQYFRLQYIQMGLNTLGAVAFGGIGIYAIFRLIDSLIKDI